MNTEFGVSTGYRILKSLLVYGGYGVSFYDSRADVIQDEARNNDVPKGNYSYEQNGRGETYALGLQFGEEVAIGVRGAWSRFKWNKPKPSSQYHAALYVEAAR